MQEPLPALTDLYLGTFHLVVLPDAFLGGCAPHLRTFILHGVAFPAFPRFVLRATHIVSLSLFDLPNSGYSSLSPEAMVNCLAALPDLETFEIEFRSPPPSPLQTTPPPRMRSVLPALTSIYFRGASEYLEGLISLIDAPHLNELSIEFFVDLIFDIPQLHEFIGRTRRLRPLNPAQLKFSGDGIRIRISLGSSPTRLKLEIICEEPGWQLSSVAQVCNAHFPLLSQVEQLDICETSPMKLAAKNEVNPSQWLELFRPFSAVRSLYVSETLEPIVAGALRELSGDRTMEVLPALENLSLDELGPSGPARDAMEPFIAVRQLSGRSVVVQRQKRRLEPKTGTPYASEDEV